MNKNFIVGFITIPSLLASFFAAHQGFFVVQTAAPTQQVSQVNSGNSAPISSVTSDTSLNWAGYVATTGTFTSVGATWTVPQSTSTNNTLSADATWVGIGGISTKDLIQAGTQNVIQNGVPTYEAWYEILPATSVQVPLTVHPGDLMTTSIVEQSTGAWEISFNDASTGQSYQTSINYNSSLSSAEWIEEMPSDQRNFVSLDNFGSVQFTNAFAVQNGVNVTPSAAGAVPMTMITSNGQAIAAPSSLGSDGASFTVTRTSATASVTTPTTTVTVIGRGRWTRAGQGAQGYTPRQETQGRFGGFSSFFRNFNNVTRGEFQSLRDLTARPQ